MNRHTLLSLTLVFGLAACTRTPPAPAVDTTDRASAAAPAAPKQLAGPLPLGTPLPDADVEMNSVTGETITLAGAAGEDGTLVVFTCNHCPYAKAWEQRIAQIGNAYAKRGFGVVAINPNDPSVQEEDAFEQMKARAKKLGLEFPYVVDATSDVARSYGATKTPEVYLFDADQKLVYHGAVDDSANDPSRVEVPYLKQALDAVLAGEPVPMTETRAVGCSIKFRPEAGR